MQTIPIYRYTRPDGGVSVSPIKPDCECVEMFRLIADEGMTLTDGETIKSCVDTDNADGWEEIVDSSDDSTEELTETMLKARAYDIITGVSE